MPSPSTVRTLFRTIAVIEACTWGGLLVGMAFKYLINGVETGVHVFGPLHGAAFVGYVAATVLAARTFRWRLPVLLAGLVASVPPLLTWPFEAWADRTGRLSPPAAVREAEPAGHG